MNNDEERVLARGLQPPGPLLIVKRMLGKIQARRLRVIVSYKEAADELVEFFEERGSKTEIDRAGSDYHVVVDLEVQRKGD